MLKFNEEDETSKYFELFIWLLMSFQAGYVNVGGFVIFGNFVSHVTGTTSQIGMGVASINFEQLITFVGLLVTFILGSAFAGHFLGRKMEENKEPEFIIVTFVKAVLFGFVLLISEHYFTDMSMEVKLTLVYLLSLACGMQNATCAIATNGFLKPTHMTGLSTDIGINLTKVFAYKKTDEKKYRDEINKNRLRFKILGSFIAGGVIAGLIFAHNGHYGFLFPFVSSFLMLMVSILSERSPNSVNGPVLKFARSSIVGIFIITLCLGVWSSFNI